MTKQQLYDLLEMDEASDLEYFEQLAELIENEQEIPYELLLSLFSDCNHETLRDLLDHYLDDFSDSVPGESDELPELAETICQRIRLLCEDLEDERNLRDLAEEIDKLRTFLHQKGGALIDGKPCTVLDALAEYRIEKLGAGRHQYDFPAAGDYEIAELSLSLGKFEPIDLLSEEQENESEEETR